MSDTVRLAIEETHARITLCRPPLNVLTTEMLGELAEAIEKASAPEGPRLIRIDAEGKAFCAGVDVGDHMGDKVRPMMDALGLLFERLERTPLPTVAVVQGAALGGGCELALGTDLCVASEAASFGQPEIRLGVFAPPASVLLPRLVGERRALGMLLTGEKISAPEAERLGLVNKVLPAERFEQEVEGWLQGLLQLSGAGLRLAKRAVREGRDRSVPEAMAALDRLYLDELMRTHDAREGLQAFLEKRKPVWQHR